jgi:hypothetical protein
LRPRARALSRLSSSEESSKWRCHSCGLSSGRAVHAIPSATVDIDLMIEHGSLDEVSKVVGNLGYTVEAKPMTFAEGKVQIRRFTKLDQDSEDVLMLDLRLVTPAVREAWQTRTRLAWGGGELVVVSREGLIQLKSIRSSAVDQEDISKLRGEKP